jgi:hypothetical protein
MCKGDIVEDRALKEPGVNGREYSPTRRTRDERQLDDSEEQQHDDERKQISMLFLIADVGNYIKIGTVTALRLSLAQLQLEGHDLKPLGLPLKLFQVSSC